MTISCHLIYDAFKPSVHIKNEAQQYRDIHKKIGIYMAVEFNKIAIICSTPILT